MKKTGFFVAGTRSDPSLRTRSTMHLKSCSGMIGISRLVYLGMVGLSIRDLTTLVRVIIWGKNGEFI